MIIQVRGTSGSGKTTLVRSIMRLYDTKCSIKMKGRRKPWGYVLSHPGRKSLYVPGHYETPCGGCDTLPDYDSAYNAIRQAHEEGMDVLYEGLLASGEFKRAANLHQDGYPYKICCLDVPIETCLEGIQDRRKARGNEKPVNPKNTIAKVKAMESSCKRLGALGVPVLWLGRCAALLYIRSELGWGG